MYDRAETAPAHDRLWERVRAGLIDAGMNGTKLPAALTRDGDVWAQWLSPDLILSQTCGYPYRARLHGKVTLVGTPDYGVPDCAPGHYYSVLIARKSDERTEFVDFRDARLAYNEPMSQSGLAAVQTHAQNYGFQFTDCLQSGAHRASALAVLNGDADIAAIDAVTWRMITQFDDWSVGLKEIAHTAPTPGLPIITALNVDPATLGTALSAAIATMSSQDAHLLGLRAITIIDSGQYLAVPTPLPPQSTN
jgi:ABC-type phosphate/phosphonate transport system substrate-binding protein